MRVLAATLALLCAGFAAPARVDYTLRPEMAEGALQAVRVELAFRGDADGETQIELPSSWGGEGELWRGIDDLRVVGGATLAEGDSPATRVLRHTPNARVTLSYRITKTVRARQRRKGVVATAR